MSQFRENDFVYYSITRNKELMETGKYLTNFSENSFKAVYLLSVLVKKYSVIQFNEFFKQTTEKGF